jgi:hypothetical protein
MKYQYYEVEKLQIPAVRVKNKAPEREKPAAKK